MVPRAWEMAWVTCRGEIISARLIHSGEWDSPAYDQVAALRELLALQKTGRTDVPIWEQDRLMPISDEAELWGEGT